MTQEEKQLLLKDILPRQLYGVKAHYQYYDFFVGSERFIQEGDGVIESIDIFLGNPVYINNHHVELENIKPYLRPMSSMTDEEANEVSGKIIHSNINSRSFVWAENCSTYIDWLLVHHFDYLGLIEKGLALEAKEGMYKTE